MERMCRMLHEEDELRDPQLSNSEFGHEVFLDTHEENSEAAESKDNSTSSPSDRRASR